MKINISILGVIVYLVILQPMYAWRWNIEVTVPEGTPHDATIYLAGNFNGWNPGDPAYRLEKTSEHRYTKMMEIDQRELEFKFTMGTWSSVELNSEHEMICNRQLTLDSTVDEYVYVVENWNSNISTKNIRGNVDILEEFYMPQLDRTRRIWIYLPPGYKKGIQRYPVMYMHDGQNLFADSTSFSGEWGIDETLETMIAEKRIEKMIIVGIENHPQYRLEEYSPFAFEYRGKKVQPQAQQYGKFIVETLKPYIDKNYRTRRGRRNTAIAGSSMGGLVSVYLALEYQDTFSKVGALSSAFGVCREDLVAYIHEHAKKRPIRYWLDMGSIEVEQMAYDVNQQKIIEALIFSGWEEGKEVQYTLYEGAGHHERYWRARFGEVLEYLWRK
jgi:pullulanase